MVGPWTLRSTKQQIKFRECLGAGTWVGQEGCHDEDPRCASAGYPVWKTWGRGYTE